MGSNGLTLLGISALCGIITGLIGNTIALSRLLYALADDGMIPKKLMKVNKRGVPWVAVCAISLLSCLIMFFGQTAIGWLVDATTVGATIVYAYTSICVIIEGKRSKKRMMLLLGVIGAASSITVALIYMLPSVNVKGQLSTVSYLLLILWCVFGIVIFRILMRRDKTRSYGKSFIVWIVLFFLILLVSVIWINKSTMDFTTSTTKEMEETFSVFAEEEGMDSDSAFLEETTEYTTVHLGELRSIVKRNILIFAGLVLFSLFVIFSIFGVIRRREKDIEAERMKAIETSRAKSTFLSNMSHDIRTPMNAITGYTTLALQEKDIPDTIREYLEKIDHSSTHLLSLINDILDMSRIESGKVELDCVPTDLFALIEEVSHIFELQMKAKNLTYYVNHDRVHDRYVICDKNRLMRIVMNLISNSYKFTPEGGKVSLILRENGEQNGKGNYELVVSDTGIGMSPEFMEHIFDAFERERTSTVSQLQGTGLGMSIAKSFIELMGGTITVSSEKGKGSEFLIRLQLPITTEDAVIKDKGTAVEQADDVTGKRLLLVEDNPINSEIAREILTRSGFEVETAENGKIAVDMVLAADPDYYSAILMDVLMPVMGGYQATIVIRSMDGRRGKIPIIALSANTFESDKKEAFAVGMNAHVSKPFDPDVLVATIKDNIK